MLTRHEISVLKSKRYRLKKRIQSVSERIEKLSRAYQDDPTMSPESDSAKALRSDRNALNELHVSEAKISELLAYDKVIKSQIVELREAYDNWAGSNKPV